MPCLDFSSQLMLSCAGLKNITIVVTWTSLSCCFLLHMTTELHFIGRPFQRRTSVWGTLQCLMLANQGRFTYSITSVALGRKVLKMEYNNGEIWFGTFIKHALYKYISFLPLYLQHLDDVSHTVGLSELLNEWRMHSFVNYIVFERKEMNT